MSGIKSLEDLRQRCRVDEQTKCWVWAGGTSVTKGYEVAYANYSPDGESATRKQMPAARAAWIASGRKAEKGRIVYRCCETKLCINPAHHKCGSRKEAGDFLAQTNRLKGSEKRIAANFKNRLKQTTSIDRVKAVESAIASGKKRYEIARELNIDLTTIRKISSGRHVYSSGRTLTLKTASIFSFGVAA